MPIDMFTKRVSNPVSRKRSHQQILQEEEEFDNSPWNDEHDDVAPVRGNKAGSSRGLTKTRAAGRASNTVIAKTNVIGNRGKGKAKSVEDDPIELDETDIEEILDDDDDVPLAVSVAKRKTTRKEIGLGARDKVVSGQASAKRVTAPWAAFKPAGSSNSSAERERMAGGLNQRDVGEISIARGENATPCEKLFDSLQTVYKGVSLMPDFAKVTDGKIISKNPKAPRLGRDVLEMISVMMPVSK